MSALADFATLALETGIALPSLLKALLSSGKTSYGSDWATTWRDKMLGGNPAFVSWYDFEWIEAADAKREIEEWLNPKAQHGKSFLPFAKSGGGDLYCLMPIEENGVGVALILHDEETSRISHQSFDDFVTVGFLKNFTNLNHLSDNFSEEEILQCVKSDVMGVTSLMNEKSSGYLRLLCERPLVKREFYYGPKARPHQVLSFISQEQLTHELAGFSLPEIDPFEIVPPWEL